MYFKHRCIFSDGICSEYCSLIINYINKFLFARFLNQTKRKTTKRLTNTSISNRHEYLHIFDCKMAFMLSNFTLCTFEFFFLVFWFILFFLGFSFVFFFIFFIVFVFVYFSSIFCDVQSHVTLQNIKLFMKKHPKKIQSNIHQSNSMF